MYRSTRIPLLALTSLCVLELTSCKEDGSSGDAEAEAVAPAEQEQPKEPEKVETKESLPEDPEPSTPEVTLEPVEETVTPPVTVGAGLPTRADETAAWILRNGKTKGFVFTDYHTDPDLPIMRSTNWTAESRTNGVAWNAAEAGTLISPQHVLLAEHYSGNLGRKLVFHDAAGFAHQRLLVSIDLAPGATEDIAIGLLDRAVPIAHYRVLPPRNDYDFLLRNSPVMVASASRQLGFVNVQAVLNGEIAFTFPYDLAENLRLELVTGDSGHPSFLQIGEEMILLSVHQFGKAGRGPFISTPENFTAINSAMARLGGGGYQLSVTSVPVP